MAVSESAVRDATLLAIADLNEKGGVLGRPVEAVEVDGKSDALAFARGAEQLIAVDQVSAVFGCWTSASRRTVKPVFERHDHLLFYPLQYEGLEQSPNIVYAGAAPNQQIVPAVQWCVRNLGRRLFLVGSDYVFPRSANAIIKVHASAMGAEVVGEDYVLLGGTDVAETVERIARAQPDVILNTINGDTNTAFFAALRARGITPEKIPTLSFSMAENEISHMDAKTMAGDYCAWNYFQSVDTPENRVFVEKLRKAHGPDQVADDPMEAAWIAVHLWAAAAEDAGTAEPAAVRGALPGLTFHAPEGLVTVDMANHHLWKTARIGRIRADGQFDVVFTSDNPLRPSPYPFFKPKEEWDRGLSDLYEGWGRHWANPGPAKGGRP